MISTVMKVYWRSGGHSISMKVLEVRVRKAVIAPAMNAPGLAVSQSIQKLKGTRAADHAIAVAGRSTAPARNHSRLPVAEKLPVAIPQASHATVKPTHRR